MKNMLRYNEWPSYMKISVPIIGIILLLSSVFVVRDHLNAMAQNKKNFGMTPHHFVEPLNEMTNLFMKMENKDPQVSAVLPLYRLPANPGSINRYSLVFHLELDRDRLRRLNKPYYLTEQTIRLAEKNMDFLVLSEKKTGLVNIAMLSVDYRGVDRVATSRISKTVFCALIYSTLYANEYKKHRKPPDKRGDLAMKAINLYNELKQGPFPKQIYRDDVLYESSTENTETLVVAAGIKTAQDVIDIAMTK